MSLLFTLLEAWCVMGQNKLRTALTTLGMVIGVGVVVVMLAIGQGARTTVNESIKSVGSNLFIVPSGASASSGLRIGAGTVPTLTVDDAAALARLDSIKDAAPVLPSSAQLAYGPSNWSHLVYEAGANYFAVREWRMESGQDLSEADVRAAARSVVLGKTVARNLFGEEEPVGKTIGIKGSPNLVVGVLANRGQSLDGRDQDGTAVVPVTTAQRKLFGNQFPSTVRYILVQARSAEAMAEAEQGIGDLLRARHRLAEDQENDFTVRNLAAVVQTAATSARAMSFMLGAIASVSLLEGGIGIMNIMMVSVTERAGNRHPHGGGARWRDILLQFLTEALMIYLIDGLAGVMAGVLSTYAIAQVWDMATEVTLDAILLSFASSAAMGVFFGFYPTRWAAGLRPVEALRYE